MWIISNGSRKDCRRREFSGFKFGNCKTDLRVLLKGAFIHFSNTSQRAKFSFYLLLLLTPHIVTKSRFINLLSLPFAVLHLLFLITQLAHLIIHVHNVVPMVILIAADQFDPFKKFLTNSFLHLLFLSSRPTNFIIVFFV